MLWKIAKSADVSEFGDDAAARAVAEAPDRGGDSRSTGLPLPALCDIPCGESFGTRSRATFRQQREGFGGKELTGEPGITGPERREAARPVPAPATKEEIWRVPQFIP